MLRSKETAELDRVITNAVGVPHTARELRDRVTLIEPRIVLMREIKDGAPATLDVIGARIEEFIQGLPRYGIVSDLTDAQSHSITAEYRAYIPTVFKSLMDRNPGLCNFATVFAGNPLARVLARFMIGRAGLPSTLHRSRELAIESVRASITAEE